MEIKTNRLIIREYDPGDFKPFYELVADPDIRHFSLLTTHHNVDSAIIEFNNILKERESSVRKRFILAVIAKDGGQYIGDVGFEILKQNATGGIAEIGYFLVKPAWGKGYGTEIASALINYCFSNLAVHKVVASCDKRNAASEKVMIKCGMKKEAEMKLNRYKDKEWHDELKYGILKEDWTAG
jgi:ribosomal-protein-alanine N-acetyltransferase